MEPIFGHMITAMITPFTPDKGVDLDKAQKLSEKLMNEGNDALVILGTTGESPTVSHQEKIKLFSAVKEVIGGKISLVANIGGNCTAESVLLAQEVEKLGVDGFMAVVPYYNKPPQEGMYQHFSTIANAVELPLIVYNIPGRCVVNMEAQTTLRLAHDCKNIVAVKEASGIMDQVSAITADAPGGFVVYSGDDSTTYEIMRRGGSGVISTIGNVATPRMKEIVDLCVAGKWEDALSAHEKLLPMMEGLFKTSNPILVKEALRLTGFDVGGVRLPLVDATPAQSAALKACMQEVGVLP